MAGPADPKQRCAAADALYPIETLRFVTAKCSRSMPHLRTTRSKWSRVNCEEAEASTTVRRPAEVESCEITDVKRELVARQMARCERATLDGRG